MRQVECSVVIPLYNKECHIQRAVDSVLAQTYSDFELIVVDDGSTDGSGDVVRGITDSRIRLITQKNAGECAARNRGIKEASGEHIAFLDADDEWLPCFLQTVMGLRARYPEAGMYATAYRMCDGEKSWSPALVHCVTETKGRLLEDYFHAALRSPPVTSSSVMIPRHVFNEVGLFPVGVKRGGDLQTWTAIALRYRVAWSPVQGAIYHQSASNRACLTFHLAPDVTVAELIEKFLASDREPISSRFYMEEYLAKCRLSDAREHLRNGRRVWAQELVNKTRNTVLSRSYRRRLQAMLLCPSWLLKAVEGITRNIRRLHGG